MTERSILALPELSLVLLIGTSGSGKSTFARKHFLPTEVIGSDYCRAMLSDDENNQNVTTEAFALLHHIVGMRLTLGKLTVVDATNLRPEDRASLVAIARSQHALPVAIVFHLPQGLCHERNSLRPDRNFGPHVIRSQHSLLKRSLKGLKREGFRVIHRFDSEEEVNAITGIERQPLWNNRKHDAGPFDIIGDVHGCFDEMRELIGKLGYTIGDDGLATHPQKRRLGFVGDLVDRGPENAKVLRFVMDQVRNDLAFCVPGNHDMKLLKYLKGKQVALTHGLAETVAELEAEPAAFREEVRDFLDSLVSHFLLDEGRLVVAHAGLKEAMQGRGSGKVRDFCLYGETTGETDEFGLPERLDWASDYRGKALVVYGHTPFTEPRWLNNTVNIDTGCAFGGQLTALRYPERETVSVQARKQYATPGRPLRDNNEQEKVSAQQLHDLTLDLADVSGKFLIETALARTVTIREENASAALEIMSRYAVDPRWLIYLPPTMSPCATSDKEGWLERPEEAFSYYQSEGVRHVVCEEKHMGSRAVVVLARNESAARKRFGTTDGKSGICYSRTGRAFFRDDLMEAEMIRRLAKAMEGAGLWEELATDWICLDCELMPWSWKARDLLTFQYAPVGASAVGFSKAAHHALETTLSHPDHLSAESQALLTTLEARMKRARHQIDDYRTAYRHYCWEAVGLDDLKLAPFHIMAAEGAVFSKKEHPWHMGTIARIAEQDPDLILPTNTLEIDLETPEESQRAIQWWETHVSHGGEGMVVKPRDFVVFSAKNQLVQPAVKVRGKEYLRIIYGPHYDAPENLTRLRQRGLNTKRLLAQREFALGLEGLQRFVNHEPLRRVHQCVFGVLAMESEAVDPRL
jgi:protein phosphatase